MRKQEPPDDDDDDDDDDSQNAAVQEPLALQLSLQFSAELLLWSGDRKAFEK